jgi:hypothetical protein
MITRSYCHHQQLGTNTKKVITENCIPVLRPELQGTALQTRAQALHIEAHTFSFLQISRGKTAVICVSN